MHRFVLAALLLAGCADPYGDAKKADTIEAYEAYLATGPSGYDSLMAADRLEQLMVEKAEASKSVPDYDAVLKRFPKSKKTEELQKGRSTAAFAIAEADGSAEAWKKFLDENSFADGTMKKKAKTMVDVAAFAPSITISEPVVAEVNLANDPKGPKDGWGFTANVTNNGTQALEYANLELQLLDGSGNKLKTMMYPIAAKSGPGGMPIEEALAKPLAPGETRVWTYSTAEIPDGWAEGKAVKLMLVGVKAAPAETAEAPK